MKIFKKLVFIFSLCVIAGACKSAPKAKFGDFTINMNSPKTKIGEIELQLDQFFGIGNFKKHNVDVFYYPKGDAVCLVYKYEFYTYYQFWDKKGRINFINALKKYNEDYDAHDLQRNNKSQLKYGTLRGYLVWQQTAVTVQAYANMDVDLGYTFKNKSPYFTVYQRSTEFVNELIGDDNIGGSEGRSGGNNRVSPNLSLFFTRAQAAVLAEIFEQYVNSAILPEFGYEEDTPSSKNEASKDAY